MIGPRAVADCVDQVWLIGSVADCAILCFSCNFELSSSSQSSVGNTTCARTGIAPGLPVPLGTLRTSMAICRGALAIAPPLRFHVGGGHTVRIRVSASGRMAADPTRLGAVAVAAKYGILTNAIDDEITTSRNSLQGWLLPCLQGGSGASLATWRDGDGVGLPCFSQERPARLLRAG